MRSILRERRFELSILALLFVLGFALHRANLQLEGRIHSTEDVGKLGPLPDGKLLRIISLGFDRLMADLFWLRTVSYIGDMEVLKVGYPDAARLGELVTDIDPKFRTVYTAMNSVLTVLKHDPDAAIALLEKGIQHNSWWKLHFLLGFNYFWEKEDWRSAAEQMETAARLGGPPYLPLLAARLYTKAGDPETAMAFVSARLRDLEPGEQREALAKRLVDLWITRDLRAIDEAIATFRSEKGRAPSSISELVSTSYLETEPRDPKGNAYRIQDGAAFSALEYERLDRVHINK